MLTLARMTSGQPTNLHSNIERGEPFAPLFLILRRSSSPFSLFSSLSFPFCTRLFLIFAVPLLIFFSFFPLLHTPFSPFRRSSSHLFLLFLSLFHALFFSFLPFPFPSFSLFRPSRSLWAHICAHPFVRSQSPSPSNNIRCAAPSFPSFVKQSENFA